MGYIARGYLIAKMRPPAQVRLVAWMNVSQEAYSLAYFEVMIVSSIVGRPRIKRKLEARS